MGAKIGFQKKIFFFLGGGMHLATLMHSRLCHLLYNHVIVLLEFQGGEIGQGGAKFFQGGARFCQGGAGAPLRPPLK